MIFDVPLLFRQEGSNNQQHCDDLARLKKKKTKNNVNKKVWILSKKFKYKTRLVPTALLHPGEIKSNLVVASQAEKRKEENITQYHCLSSRDPCILSFIVLDVVMLCKTVSTLHLTPLSCSRIRLHRRCGRSLLPLLASRTNRRPAFAAVPVS